MQKFRRHFSMAVTGSSLDCRNENRQALNYMIEQNGYSSKVIVLKKDKWNPLGFKDSRHLYKEDEIHLNHKGYEILDNYIITSILKDYYIKMQFSQ